MHMKAQVALLFIFITFPALVVISVILGHAATKMGIDSDTVVGGVKQLDSSTFSSFVGGDKATLVHVRSSTCSECTNVSDSISRLMLDISQDKTIAAGFTMGEFDSSDFPALARQLKIETYPALLYFPPQANKSSDNVTGKDFTKFDAFLKRITNYQDPGVPVTPIPGDITDPPSRIPATTSPPSRIPAKTSPPNEPKDMIILDSMSVQKIINPGRQKSSLVMFYATWCSHSKRLLPIFDQLPRAYRGNKDVQFGRIDNDKWNQWGYMNSLGSNGVPTVVYYPKGNGGHVIYRSGRDVVSFSNFLDQQSI